MFVKFILKENNDAYCRRLLHVCGTITKLYMVHCTLWVTLFCQEGCRRKKEKNNEVEEACSCSYSPQKKKSVI